MTIKDIVVQLDPSAASGRRLELACALARRHGAHLRGVLVVDVVSMGGVMLGDDIGAARIIEEFRARALKDAVTVEADFHARVSAAGVPGEWSLMEASAAETITRLARLADLVVLGQTDPENSGATGNGLVAEQVLFGAGRPVLLVPYAGSFSDLGRHAVIGWTPRRESSRALHDALALLAPGAHVTVMTAARNAAEDGPGMDAASRVALHLARHGFAATAREVAAEGIEPADVLLNAVSDLGADLLVVGAYGHSRLREWVMGGVTRSLLAHATVPVLLSH